MDKEYFLKELEKCINFYVIENKRYNLLESALVYPKTSDEFVMINMPDTTFEFIVSYMITLLRQHFSISTIDDSILYEDISYYIFDCDCGTTTRVIEYEGNSYTINGINSWYEYLRVCYGKK